MEGDRCFRHLQTPSRSDFRSVQLFNLPAEPLCERVRVDFDIVVGYSLALLHWTIELHFMRKPQGARIPIDGLPYGPQPARESISLLDLEKFSELQVALRNDGYITFERDRGSGHFAAKAEMKRPATPETSPHARRTMVKLQAI